MRFKGLDLNLLVALDALLETRSVSRAAERLNLSQPAVSAALSRLRSYFKDDILVVTGKHMYLTAYAEGILPELRECLNGLDALVSSSTSFEPTTSQRRFVIVASDYITATVLAPMIAEFARTAPAVGIALLAPSEDSNVQLADGKVDMVLTPEQFVHPDHPAELLFQERHVVVGWSGNPLLPDNVTEESFCASGHVAVAVGPSQTASFADRQLALLGKSRKVEIASSTFVTVPWLLRDTMRLAVMHERLATKMSKIFPIAIAPLPFHFPLMNEMVQYHRSRARDQGIRWLVKELMRHCG